MSRKWVYNSKEIQLPVYFYSISSVKTRLNTLEYLRILIRLECKNLLVSAYDFNNCHDVAMIQRVLNNKPNGTIILMDCGNYESYWMKDKSWSQNDFHNTHKKYKPDYSFSFDNNTPSKDIEAFTPELIESYQSDCKAMEGCNLIPILHGECSDICERLDAFLSKSMIEIIAVPERILGGGIYECCLSIIKIREVLNSHNNNIKLHLLGTGNPISILLFSLAGADSFDGLEWCQTVVDHFSGRLHHLSHWDFFKNQTGCSNYRNVPFEQSILAHNIIFYEKFMKDLQDAIKSESVDLMLRHFLPNGEFLKVKELLRL